MHFRCQLHPFDADAAHPARRADEAAARTLAGEASYACGQPVELRRLQG